MIIDNKDGEVIDTMNCIKLNGAVSMYEAPVLQGTDAGHVMALTISKQKTGATYEGLARLITNRTGGVDTAGFVDKSSLCLVEGKDPLSWDEKGKLYINGIEEVIKSLKTEAFDYQGLEDPDIWEDKENGMLHVYYTIAFVYKTKPESIFYLGHATGKNLHNLTATAPVLSPIPGKMGFKEVTVSPRNEEGYRLNLTESFEERDGIFYSTINTVKAKDMGEPWEYVSTSLHPADLTYSWCGGHVSPCTLFQRDFLKYDDSLLVGLINGREQNTYKDGQTMYGRFSPGLILYNPETGEIPWVSPQSLFDDPDAKTVTFASDFLQTNSQEGILYAHVDDSFVRAYHITASELYKCLPQ